MRAKMAAMAPALRLLALALGLTAALAACSIEATTFTPLSPAAEDCAAPGDEDGDGLADCADPDCAGAPACQPAARCGDGVRDPAEACDDGNLMDGDGCDNNCTVTACGNGVVSGTEACDDGNATSGDGCDANCTVTACGNGVLTAGEACDDGNTTTEACAYGASSCTVCSATCQLVAGATALCGDGTTNAPFESCDDGNTTTEACTYGAPSCTVCDATCHSAAGATAFCGDGVTNAPFEVCDDGNTTNGDGCDSNCTIPECGNGVVSGAEVCDDGNTTSGDGCDSNCTPTGCGNGVRTAGEQCDDGNLTNGDGCDSNCTFTGCGNGVVVPPEICDDGNTTSGDGCDANCKPTGCGNGVPTTGEQCDDGNTTPGDGCENDCTVTPLATSYIKASNTGSSDEFGYSVALSADGSTLAVSAVLEASAARGVNGNQADNSATGAGAVYIYVRSGASWAFQAYIKASNTDANDQFGFSMTLSADGSTLAVGARLEASAATGINGNQADNSASNAGAVYVFTRSGTTWAQQAYVKASNTGASDGFGYSVALSADGATLAVGAVSESSAATGVDGNQADNSASNAGAVYVFKRSGATWAQQAYVKASNTGAGDGFGYSVALSGDGATLAVGAFFESSSATGVNGNQTDNSASGAGAAYVFTRSGATWAQQAYLKASNTGIGDEFGLRVALSADSSTLAVGAFEEDSAATGIGGNQADNSALNAGAAYVFTRSGTAWAQQAYVKASNSGAGDLFGIGLSLSSDGRTLAVGAYGEASAATGIDGNQADNSAGTAGAAYVFRSTGTTWAQTKYIKAINTDANDAFGFCVALSSDGATLAVSAPIEDGAGVGVGADPASNGAPDAGAVYTYR